MKKILGFAFCFCICINYTSFSQNEDGFQFHRDLKKRYKIKFTNYNNLIIINAKLNGKNMNFLLDTGVDKTVLFGLEDNQNQIKQESDKILIKGVSGQKKTFAYKIENNILEIDKLKDNSHVVYAIFDKSFNISDKIGYQIQGILGYEFFKNLIVKINYHKNHLKVYRPKKFNKSLRNYDVFDLRLYNQKPYIKTQLKQNKQWKEYVFLLDTGSGDAIWVRPNSMTEIPKVNFNDILGYGFADIIKGKRAKANALEMGSEVMENPKIAYPDTIAYNGVDFSKNNGVLGSEILRRFHWYFDYSNSKVYFKPNKDIDAPFNYDMSGLVLIYDGYQQIAQYQNIFPQAKVKNDNSSGYNKVDNAPQIVVELRPILKVGAIRPNSSAYEAGFVRGDEILEIENRDTYKYDLEEIMDLLSSEEGKEINFLINRAGRQYEKTLILKSRFLE